MNFYDNLRRTGRTTNMLMKAVESANSGRAVYIFVATENHRREIAFELKKLYGINPADGRGIKIEIIPNNFDWYQMRGIGMHRNSEVFVDHFVIESQFANILHELHRYDHKKEDPVYIRKEWEEMPFQEEK